MTDGIRLLRRRIVRLSSCSRREAEEVAIRHLLREAFGREVKLMHQPCGRPFIEGFPHFISISHCRDEAVLAISSGCEVGVDIETWRDALMKTAHKWLTPRQLERMEAPLDYLKAWTAKEAIFKCMSHQPHGLMDIALPYIGEQSIYKVCWEGDVDRLLAIAHA